MAVLYFPWQGVRVQKERNPSITLRVIVDREPDILAATAAVGAATNYRYLNLVRKAIRLNTLGPHTWEAEVDYGLPDSTEVMEISWSVSSRQVRVTQALETVAVYGDPRIDAKGLIGATLKEGELVVEGADVIVPQSSLSISVPVPPEYASMPAFVTKMVAYTGTVNKDPFLGFPAGTLLFTGAQGRATFESNPENSKGSISYEFSFEPNRTNLAYGNITVPFKYGHDLVDVEYQGNMPGQNRLITQPVAVKIHRVYPFVSFSGLL